MQNSKFLLGAALGVGLAIMAWAAERPLKMTCGQEAAAKQEECKHRCCINAHQEGKSCVKCNPKREDLKGIKDPKGPKK